MRLSKLFLTAAALLSTAALAHAADFKVIANPSVKASEISAGDLKAVFLATKTSLPDGSHVEPVWAKGGAIHESFLKEYAGKTDAAIGLYYRSLVLTGKASMPKSFGSDAEAAAYVAKTKGAIGYVGAGVGGDGVKTIDVK
jgi:hypothetical protein